MSKLSKLSKTLHNHLRALPQPLISYMALTARRSPLSPAASPSPTPSVSSYHTAVTSHHFNHSLGSHLGLTATCDADQQAQPGQKSSPGGDYPPLIEVHPPQQGANCNGQLFLLPRRLYLYGLVDCYRATEELQEEFDVADCDAIDEERDVLNISTERIRELYYKARATNRNEVFGL